MARSAKQLTDTALKKVKADDKDLILSDGNGLQVKVRKSGSKLWNFNYYHPITKKRINMGLGKYPDISIVNARKLAQEARELVALGTDPKEHRDETLAFKRAQEELTLNKVALEWFEVKKQSLTKDYGEDIWRSLNKHILSVIGKYPIGKINAPQVIKILKPIEAKGTLETVKRLCLYLRKIMIHAVNSGYINANPLAGISEVFKKPQKQNMPSLKPEELPELMQTLAIASIKRVTRFLIEWQLHTLTRPGEAAGTRWDEIDFGNKLWTIPPERMKKRREHVIPLSKQALELLEAIKPISGHREFVFPSDRNPRNHINNETANMALKRMGFEGRLVSHGLRSLGSTTLNEHEFNPDVIEAALAHVDKNQVRSAYNRAEYIEKRRELMNWWSDHIGRASQGTLSVTGHKHLLKVG
ncbi:MULTISPECIES: integrase domain-containing protein [unclassified Pseudoalteromonas]|uniref:integrase domain-containing protein n=1 Tax=unclassified Pseudoalteromonas TaxID=194690 RepID=UPI0016026CF1|nr:MULTISPECIES: integrase domain-containing protein [unclassified Pseudoalteromonas]MBB1350960.1 tyrosine-type recombinase/integrase [Pseudoalteromonas sp. SG45-3]MBB1359498.1 tyrosine-type recombinase/integrase [Pseudoalteromonas sp. SG45-6]